MSSRKKATAMPQPSGGEGATAYVLRGLRVVLPRGVRPASIVVEDGVIRWIGAIDADAGGRPVVDVGERVVMPGVVDTHVHVNEPGRADWEGFESATRAAAAGGITTIVDMPLNSVPPTTSTAGLEAKASAAEGRCRVDYAFWGGLVPGNEGDLPDLLDRGLPGVKAFLCPSGVDEFPMVGDAELERAMKVLAERGKVLLAHAESPARLRTPARGRKYRSYLASRPPSAEEEAVALLTRLCRKTGCRVHVVHLAAAGAVDAIALAKAEGLPVTAETCPHYLFFSAEDIEDGETLFKCAPPIRDAAHRERLWDGLRAGAIDLIASDHSPCPPALKAVESGDFAAAWGGVSSLQLSLPAVWTAARKRGFGLLDMAGWLCRAPARLAGLDERKGSIAKGQDADFVVWDPEAVFTVLPDELHHRHRAMPYAGRSLTGVVERTFVRGRLVYADRSFAGEPAGEWVLAAA